MRTSWPKSGGGSDPPRGRGDLEQGWLCGATTRHQPAGQRGLTAVYDISVVYF